MGKRWWSWMVMLGLAVGCGGEEEMAPDVYTFAGNWAGTYQDPGGGALTITATMNDNAGSISGNGNLAISGGTPFNCATSVSGTRSDRSFALAFACAGFEILGFAGSMPTPSTAQGQLNGSGFSGEAFTMRRQ